VLVCLSSLIVINNTYNGSLKIKFVYPAFYSFAILMRSIVIFLVLDVSIAVEFDVRCANLFTDEKMNKLTVDCFTRCS
jgi:hypothetical protein